MAVPQAAIRCMCAPSRRFITEYSLSISSGCQAALLHRIGDTITFNIKRLLNTMSSSKISPILPLSIGAVFIAAAAIGLVLSLTRDGDGEAADSLSNKPPRVVAPHRETSPPKPNVEHDKVEEVVAEKGPSEEELRRQLVRILLGRIAQTDREFNGAWLQKTHQFIKTPEDLRAFWDEYLQIGRSRSALMARAQAHSKRDCRRIPVTLYPRLMQL